MDWFDEQVRQRMKADDDAFSYALASMAGVVMGRGITAALENDRARTKSATDEILTFYRVKPAELPEEIQDVHEQLEYLTRPSGIMRRKVLLRGDWYKSAVGAFLARRKDGGISALIPQGMSGYAFFESESGKRVKVTQETAALFEEEAICFYKPLPLKKLGLSDLVRYIAETLSAADYGVVALGTLAVTLLGMLTPRITKIIFGPVLQSSDIRLYFAALSLLAAVTISTVLLSATKKLLLSRLESKMSTAVEAAAMMRLLSLYLRVSLRLTARGNFRTGRGAVHGAQLGFLPRVYNPDFPLRPRPRGERAPRCPCDGCILPGVRLCADKNFPAQHGSRRQRIGADLFVYFRGAEAETLRL